MDKIITNTPCKYCKKTSTYVKTNIKGKTFYICENCKKKICSEDKIFDLMFEYTQKPVSSRAKNFTKKKK